MDLKSNCRVLNEGIVKKVILIVFLSSFGLNFKTVYSQNSIDSLKFSFESRKIIMNELGELMNLIIEDSFRVKTTYLKVHNVKNILIIVNKVD